MRWNVKISVGNILCMLLALVGLAHVVQERMPTMYYIWFGLMIAGISFSSALCVWEEMDND